MAIQEDEVVDYVLKHCEEAVKDALGSQLRCSCGGWMKLHSAIEKDIERFECDCCNAFAIIEYSYQKYKGGEAE